MDSRSWEAVKARYHEGQDRPRHEWPDFVASAFPDRPDLRTELERLLRASADAGDFLEAPVLAPSSTDALEGRRVGPYKLIQRIGLGGMGEVHLARRADDVYRKQVAIKVIRRSVADVAFIRRFEHERETVARLDHPHIAKLLDGGTTDKGLPYFVMDWVDGMPIDRYASQHGLSVAVRLQLFQQVCSAVAYAHCNLVVHRDLKPANILVTHDGVVKLVDFGIAKLLGAARPAEPALTLTQAPLQMMTPDYASPEQVLGQPITTASDIYSLGQILHELLTGFVAGDLRGKRFDEIVKFVLETPPERPSAVLRRTAGREQAGDSASRTAAPPDARRDPGMLAGDLDAIVLMALRKEPSRRYPSVAHLSSDIDRYLSRRPVLARHGAVTYRVSKFVRRHRSATAAAILLVIAIASGIGATVWQARRADIERGRAERRFNEVRTLANALLFPLHDGIAQLPGSTATRELLIRHALEYLNGLAHEGIPDAVFRQELAAAYRRVGDVQGNPYIANVGDVAGAVASYRRALQVLRGAGAEEARTAAHRQAAAEAHEGLGDVLIASGDVGRGLEHHEQALAIWKDLAAAGNNDDERAVRAGEEVVGADRSDTDTQYELASGYANIASVHVDLARSAASPSARRRHWEHARALYERGRNQLAHLKANARLRPDGDASLAAIEARIAECDEALAGGVRP